MKKPIYLHPEAVRLASAMAGHSFVNWLEKLSQQTNRLDPLASGQQVVWFNIRTLVVGALQDSHRSGVTLRVWLEQQLSSGWQSQLCSDEIRTHPRCVFGEVNEQGFHKQMINMSLLAHEEIGLASGSSHPVIN